MRQRPFLPLPLPRPHRTAAQHDAARSEPRPKAPLPPLSSASPILPSAASSCPSSSLPSTASTSYPFPLLASLPLGLGLGLGGAHWLAGGPVAPGLGAVVDDNIPTYLRTPSERALSPRRETNLTLTPPPRPPPTPTPTRRRPAPSSSPFSSSCLLLTSPCLLTLVGAGGFAWAFGGPGRGPGERTERGAVVMTI